VTQQRSVAAVGLGGQVLKETAVAESSEYARISAGSREDSLWGGARTIFRREGKVNSF
jgi:hypothetical protein